tara:strand:+ start:1085 stop:1675 length:591 start_codon:yes stop_codon:yes gene_type:complete
MLIAIVGLLITSCSGTENSSTSVESAELSQITVTPGNVNFTEEQIATRYVDCLREKGFVLADPTVNYDGTIDWSLIKSSIANTLDAETSDSAYINKNKREISLKECSVHLGDGVISKENEQEDIIELQDDLLLLSECMRFNGVDVPDPDFSGDDKSGWQDGLDLAKNSKNHRVQRNLKECTDLVFTGASKSKSYVK